MATTTDEIRSIYWTYTAHLFGWIYTGAWSVSFYPQIWLNFKTSSTDGLSYDFAVYNLVGFVAYLCYDIIRFVTQQRYHLASAVEIQDLCFAIHAFAMTAIMCGQILAYDRAFLPYKFSKVCIIAILVTIVVFLLHFLGYATGFMLLTNTPDKNKSEYMFPLWTVTEFMGAVKVIVTVVKYLPQIVLNFQRKMTRGMAVWGFNLDAIGGVLSLAQNFVEAYNHRDPTYISGNLPKIGIGMIGLTYDACILTQHYVIYRRNNAAHTPCPSITTKDSLNHLDFVDTRSSASDQSCFSQPTPPDRLRIEL